MPCPAFIALAVANPDRRTIPQSYLSRKAGPVFGGASAGLWGRPSAYSERGQGRAWAEGMGPEPAGPDQGSRLCPRARARRGRASTKRPASPPPLGIEEGLDKAAGSRTPARSAVLPGARGCGSALAPRRGGGLSAAAAQLDADPVPAWAPGAWPACVDAAVCPCPARSRPARRHGPYGSGGGPRSGQSRCRPSGALRDGRPYTWRSGGNAPPRRRTDRGPDRSGRGARSPTRHGACARSPTGRPGSAARWPARCGPGRGAPAPGCHVARGWDRRRA